MNFDKQRVSSIVRQVLAICVTVIGVLSADHTILGSLPAWATGVLVAFGPVLLTVEHYLSDPSSGTPAMPPAPPSASMPQHAKTEPAPAPPVFPST